MPCQKPGIDTPIIEITVIILSKIEYCLVADIIPHTTPITVATTPLTAARAKETGSTRAAACMEKAAELDKKLIIAVGNAPTALVRLYELIGEGKIKPALIIGVPVGFVNVVQSKELIMQTNIPYIVARGRKGGSNIAACICNALLYMMDQDRGY